ncbi:uncharacterized protein LOC115767357 [Drosophila novamexicana]|uniref:uncharacterized protein LOC115767357 n=1 Tax=Drosophila novamexicana TaxID=47314 RepID=UPI0011E5FDAF|nr:uncharacterized protein LOC115767357 [Drosophila novamexicana]
MVADTDPKIFRLSQSKPLLMMMLMQSLEEQVQADEDMDSNVPTVTMPPADLDIVDPLSQGQIETTIEIMEITDECDDLNTMEVAEECQVDEYHEDDSMMMEGDHNNTSYKCHD